MNPMTPLAALRRRRVPAGSTLAALAVAALALAGCGGSSPDTTATSAAAGPGAAGGQDLEGYRSCLAEHGVTLPSDSAGQPPGASGMPAPPAGGMPNGVPGAPSGMPSGGPGGPGGGSAMPVPDGVDADAFAAAQQACQDLRPTGGPGGGIPPSGAGQADSSALQAFRSCLSDHGLTLAATVGPESLDRTDPDVQAALSVCEVLLPSAAPAPEDGTPAPTASASASPALATT